jgi:signal transduction histidine kinase
MQKLTDLELIDEIRQRFELNRNALHDLKVLTQKLEKMNEKLQESEALKSHFLSNIRNEINNPLSAIMGLASQCAAPQADINLCRKHSGMIYTEAFNLDFQLQNIFMAAELEAGEAEPSYAMVDIHTVVATCLEKMAQRIIEKKLDVMPVVPEELVFVTDAQKFELIVSNLLANAVEFIHCEGHIDISVEETGEGLSFTISDNGPGIDPVAQEKVFDRFRQLEHGLTKSHRGHGLGLSVCRAVTELLGGRLEMESRPGQGSRFTICLPRSDRQVETQAKDANLFLFDRSDDVEMF